MNEVFLSFLTPLSVLVLIVLTRRVIFSMILGIVLGGVLMCGNPIELVGFLAYRLASVFYSFQTQTFKSSVFYLFGFLLILGVLSRLLLVSGVAREFELWAKNRVQTQKRAELLVFFTGIVVFLNGYLSATISGGVAKPLNRYSSPQRMAYIIDSTAVPVCVLIPISSWGAYILGLLGDNMSHLGLFFEFSSAIMQSFYAWFALIAVFVTICWKIDLGAMRNFTPTTSSCAMRPLSPCASSLWLILFPIIFLILTTSALMFGLGIYHSHSLNIWEILSNTDMIFSLFCGGVSTLVLIVIKNKQKLPKKAILSSFILGIKEMIPLLSVLILAWILGSIIKDDLKSGIHLFKLLSTFEGFLWLLPACMFIFSALISFATGSGGGSLAMMIPLSLDLSMQTHSTTSILLASVISGAIYGDHASPFSDTTIISASSANCSLQSHFVTQLPYATLVAFCSLVGFVVEGLSENVYLAFGMGLILLLGVLFLNQKNKQIFR